MANSGVPLPPPLPPPPSQSNNSKATGKELLSASWKALKQDKIMLAFPVIGGIVSVVAASIFFSFVFLTNSSTSTSVDSTGTSSSTSIWVWVAGAVSVWITTIIAVWTNIAIVAGASARMDGNDPTFGYCVSKANSRLPQIIAWATLTAVVSIILRAIVERFGAFGAIIASVLGGGWAIITYFAIPVILEENVGPFKAVTRSKDIMFSTFGKVVRTSVRYGLFVLLFFAIILVGGGIGIFLMISNMTVLGVLILALTALAVLIGILIMNTLTMYIRTTLYRYATEKPIPDINKEILQGAFIIKT